MFFAENKGRGKWLLTNCLLADVKNGALIPEASILIEDGVITAAGPEPIHAEDAKKTDLNGAMVTPGLIDSHVHLCMDATADCHLHLDTADEDKQIETLRDSLLRNLEAGVTTVRDMGSRIQMLRQMKSLEAGGGLYPSVQAAGPALTVEGGHAMFVGVVANPQNAAELIDRALGEGADFVKIIGTGGNLSPKTDVHDCQYSDDDFAALVNAARTAGVFSACHAHSERGIAQCIKYGVRSIEHGSYMTAAQVEALKGSTTYWVPTICPGRLIPGLSKAAQDRVNQRRKNIRYAVEIGMFPVAGTDAGIGGAVHGCLAHELDEFTDAGMTPMQALEAGTYRNAVMMGIQARKGSLCAGKDADILIFEKSLADMAFSFHSPAVIIKGGVIAKNTGALCL